MDTKYVYYIKFPFPFYKIHFYKTLIPVSMGFFVIGANSTFNTRSLAVLNMFVMELRNSRQVDFQSGSNITGPTLPIGILVVCQNFITLATKFLLQRFGYRISEQCHAFLIY
jgi:hypothetical protein